MREALLRTGITIENVSDIEGEELEGVSDSEVECECVFRLDIEISSAAGIVRRMDSVSEVTADYEHTDVDSKSDTCSESQIFEEVFSGDFPTGAVRVFFEQPYITCVEENGAMEDADDGESIFRIEFNFECTGLVEISINLIFGCAIRSGSDRADGECSNRVGATDIELFRVWYFGRVSVGVCNSDEGTRNEPMLSFGYKSA